MISNFIIYGLTDPNDSSHELRYVGRSMSGLVRPSRHFAGSYRKQRDGRWQHDQYVNRWIRSLDGRRPEIVVLEEIDFSVADPDADLNMQEALAIEFYRELGHRLTNGTAGGEGTRGHRQSIDTRQKIGASNSVALLGNVPWNKGKKGSQVAWNKGLKKESF